MNLKNYSVKVGIKLDEQAVANVQKDLNEKLKNEKITISFSAEGLDSINKKMDEISSKLTKISGSDGFNKTSAGAKNAAKGAKELNNELEKTTKHIKNQSFATDNWAYNWAKAMQSFLTYNTVTQFFNTIMNGVRDMIDQVKELDDALVELQKVTDLEGNSLKKFVKDAYEAGESVAKTGTQMVEAATSFAKAGYKDTALDLGKVAAMYTNIADEEISSADAADFLIAQLKAFNLESQDTNKTLENSYHIIDAVNEVSNNFAVSSSDIARNMGKASAVMANAGNSMEQMIGLMTAGTEVTRNASKVANGLKTLTLRLQGMDDEGNRSLEVQAQMESLFNKLGISVYDANGELKNTYDILATLAPVYEKLSNAEKAYVTETIAGKYQAQNAAAILSNWETAVNATTTAMNSNGSAAKENEKVLESIQGRLQKLQSQWEEFSYKIVSSDLIKGVLSLLTNILKILNSDVAQFAIRTAALVVVFKGLGGLLTSGISKFKEFKNGISSVVKEVGGLNGAIQLLTAREKLHDAQQALSNGKLKEAKSILKEAGISTDGLTKKKEVQDLVNKKLAASTLALNLAISAGVAVISLIISAYQSYQRHQEEISEHNKELAKSVVDGTSEIQTQKKELEDLAAEYEKLNKDGGLGNNEETKRVEESINKILETRKKSVDLINGSYKEQKEIIASVVDELDKASQKELERAKIAAEQEAKKANDKYSKKDSAPAYLIEKYSGVTDSYTDVNREGYKRGAARDEYIGKDLEGKIKELKKLQDFITEYYNDSQYNWGKNKKREMADELAELDKILKEMEDAQNNYDSVTQKIEDVDLKDKLKDSFKIDTGSSSKEVDKFIDKVKKSTKYTDKQKKRLLELAKDVLPSYSSSLDEAQHQIDVMNGYINHEDEGVCELIDDTEKSTEAVGAHIQSQAVLNEQTKALNENLDSIQNAYSTLSGAIAEYNENGFLTIDTLQSVLSLSDGYIASLVNENGQLSLNEEAYKRLVEAQLAEMEAAAVNQAMIDLETLSNNNNASAVDAVRQKYVDLSTQLSDIALKYDEVIQKKKEFENTEDAGTAQSIIDAMQNKLTLIKQTRDGINKNLSKTIGGGGSSRSSGGGGGRSGGGGSSKASTTKEKEWWEKEYDALKSQFDYSEITIEQYIGGLEGILNRLDRGSEAWKKINKELQKQKLDKIKDDYDAGRISLNQYIISLQNLQKAYAAGTAEWNKLAESIKKAKLDLLKKQEDDLKAALSAVTNTLDKQIEKYEEEKEAVEKRYEAEIEGLEKVQEALEDQDDDYQKAQEAVSKFLDEQLDTLQKQKEDLENYYDNVIDSIEAMNEESEKSLALAEAYEALMNAMTEKTKKVWKEGLGWVWTTDTEAIKEAKKTYEDLVKETQTRDIEKQRDKTVASLEDQIAALEEYINSWDKVFDKFSDEENRNMADLLLGENWTEMVSQLDPQVVEDFSNAYYDLQVNLKETEKQLEELNKQKEEEEKYWEDLIENLETYKDKWDDVADAYEEAQDALKARQLIGAQWEKQILDQRLDVLENFKNKYNAILAEIDKVDNMSDNQASGYNPYKLPGYSNGGEVDFTGLAVLHGSPSRPEYVLNNDQMRNLLSHLTKPQISSNFKGNAGAVVNNYNFGNIELPNVNNAQQFINELKSLVNTSKNL